MFLNSSNQLNALVNHNLLCENKYDDYFFKHFWHLWKFPQLWSSLFQFCLDKTGINRPKVAVFFCIMFSDSTNEPNAFVTIIFCKKLSIIFSSISDIFHSFFQFCPVSSSFVRTKPEEIGFFHFFPGVPEEIGFFRKKPNPAITLQ